MTVENWIRDLNGLCNPGITPKNLIPNMDATTKPEVQVAKKFCNLCVVIRACYDVALAYAEMEGVRGGTSAKERRAIRVYLKEHPGTIAPPQPRA